jgi:uncharacterized membrane protein
MSRSRRRVAYYLLAVLATAVGLALLRHPIPFWPYGAARKSDAPPILGVGLLVVPIVVAGVGFWRLWDAVSLDVEAWREQRRRERNGG